MGALAVPKKLSITSKNRAITSRIGVKFNGEIRKNDVREYDIEAGYIVPDRGEQKGQRVFGKVEAFWLEK